MEYKTQIDAVINKLPFPTPKQVIWILKQDGVILSQPQEQYVWDTVEIALQNKMMSLSHPSQIASIQKYLTRNFPDWSEDKQANTQDLVNITISTANDSENKI